jgi:hypothetical protein
MNRVAIVDAMFASALSDSRTRPRWLTAGDPVTDAKYRLSILLGAPPLLVIVGTLAIVAQTHPGLVGRITCGAIAACALAITNVGAYIYLSTRMDRSHAASGRGRGPHSNPGAVLAVYLFCIACVPGYCVAIVVAAAT